MTDPAPPARTTLTRDTELAIHVEELIFDGDTGCGSRLRWALARARAEGRLAGLEEAAKFCELYPSSLHVAAHLRLLAEDAPQAPKDLKPEPEPTP